MKETFISAAAELNIAITARQIHKLFELNEQLKQRTGIIVFGRSGVGKSVLWKVLHRALEKTGVTINVFAMNAKSMPRNRVNNKHIFDIEFKFVLFSFLARWITTRGNGAMEF